MKSYKNRIIIIGDPQIGKSSILKRYFLDQFDRSHISTLGVDFFMKEREINGNNIKLQVWDTAGQERFNSVIENFFREVCVVILVYDITDRLSYKHVKQWIEKVNKVDKPGMIYLIGNKIDLEIIRDVSTKEASKYAESIGARFMEVSAKTNKNNCIKEIFNSIYSDIYNIIKYNPEKLNEYHIILDKDSILLKQEKPFWKRCFGF
jgi:small GTP-binding protein